MNRIASQVNESRIRLPSIQTFLDGFADCAMPEFAPSENPIGDTQKERHSGTVNDMLRMWPPVYTFVLFPFHFSTHVLVACQAENPANKRTIQRTILNT